MLELKNCSIGIGKSLYRIDKVNVQSGKLTALIGANGAGKSTLVNAIASGNTAMGAITWNSVSLSAFSSQEKAQFVSLVESKFSGAQYLSTKEYLELGRFPYTGLSGKLNENDRSVVREFSQRLQLEDLMLQSTLTLSDGERQRASIARALIQQTPLMLLDEPTSFLDYPNKRSIMRLLSEIAHQDNKAVLMASHDLDLCLEYCDEVLVINPATNMLESYEVKELTLEKLVFTAFGNIH